MRAQLEALVAEKSALAQENARLLRENTGLQELLSYTMHHNGGGEADQFFSFAQCAQSLTHLLPNWCAKH